jgi:hypothetical protein
LSVLNIRSLMNWSRARMGYNRKIYCPTFKYPLLAANRISKHYVKLLLIFKENNATDIPNTYLNQFKWLLVFW